VYDVSNLLRATGAPAGRRCDRTARPVRRFVWTGGDAAAVPIGHRPAIDAGIVFSAPATSCTQDLSQAACPSRRRSPPASSASYRQRHLPAAAAAIAAARLTGRRRRPRSRRGLEPHDFDAARSALAADVHVTATSTQPTMAYHPLTASSTTYRPDRVRGSSRPGSARVLASVGDERNALLLLAVEANSGAGPVTLNCGAALPARRDTPGSLGRASLARAHAPHRAQRESVSPKECRRARTGARAASRSAGAGASTQCAHVAGRAPAGGGSVAVETLSRGRLRLVQGLPPIRQLRCPFIGRSRGSRPGRRTGGIGPLPRLDLLPQLQLSNHRAGSPPGRAALPAIAAMEPVLSASRRVCSSTASWRRDGSLAFAESSVFGNNRRPCVVSWCLR